MRWHGQCGLRTGAYIEAYPELLAGPRSGMSAGSMARAAMGCAETDAAATAMAERATVVNFMVVIVGRR